MVQTSEKHRTEVKELQGICPEKLLLRFLYLGFEITSIDNTGSRRKFREKLHQQTSLGKKKVQKAYQRLDLNKPELSYSQKFHSFSVFCFSKYNNH